MLVGIAGELDIDGKPDRLAIFPRNAHRILHALRAPRHRGHVLGKLHRCEDLAQDGTQLYLAHDTPGLHVGEHALEVAHAGGQPLHRAQAAVHLLEPGVDAGERLREPLVERALERLVNRGAHGLERLGILRTEPLDALGVLHANALEALGVVRPHGLEPTSRLRAELGHLVCQAREPVARLRELNALQLAALRGLTLEHRGELRCLGGRTAGTLGRA